MAFIYAQPIEKEINWEPAELNIYPGQISGDVIVSHTRKDGTQIAIVLRPEEIAQINTTRRESEQRED